MNIQEIEKLAQLARIELSDAEKKDLLTDIEKILGFVGQVQLVTADVAEGKQVGVPHNVMRDDSEPHEKGLHTEAVLREAPETKDGYVKVKKIL